METELSEKQFDVLVQIAKSSGTLSQRQLQERTRYSLGTVNAVVKELAEKGLIKDNRISPEGTAALEPYRAKRAVFIAAGFGTRLVPITLNTPKPLVRVNGKRIIFESQFLIESAAFISLLILAVNLGIKGLAAVALGAYSRGLNQGTVCLLPKKYCS